MTHKPFHVVGCPILYRPTCYRVAGMICMYISWTFFMYESRTIVLVWVMNYVMMWVARFCSARHAVLQRLYIYICVTNSPNMWLTNSHIVWVAHHRTYMSHEPFHAAGRTVLLHPTCCLAAGIIHIYELRTLIMFESRIIVHVRATNYAKLQVALKRLWCCQAVV